MIPNEKVNSEDSGPDSISFNRVPLGDACDANPLCDQKSGCISPSGRLGSLYELLPKGQPDTEKHIRENTEFFECRAQAALEAPTLEIMYSNLAGTSENDLNESERFAEVVYQANSDIFWAPTSKSSKIITRTGDEVRSVFSPIPEHKANDKLPHRTVQPIL